MKYVRSAALSFHKEHLRPALWNHELRSGWVYFWVNCALIGWLACVTGGRAVRVGAVRRRPPPARRARHFHHPHARAGGRHRQRCQNVSPPASLCVNLSKLQDGWVLFYSKNLVIRLVWFLDTPRCQLNCARTGAEMFIRNEEIRRICLAQRRVSERPHVAGRRCWWTGAWCTSATSGTDAKCSCSRCRPTCASTALMKYSCGWSRQLETRSCVFREAFRTFSVAECASWK